MPVYEYIITRQAYLGVCNYSRSSYNKFLVGAFIFMQNFFYQYCKIIFVWSIFLWLEKLVSLSKSICSFLFCFFCLFVCLWACCLFVCLFVFLKKMNCYQESKLHCSVEDFPIVFCALNTIIYTFIQITIINFWLNKRYLFLSYS